MTSIDRTKASTKKNHPPAMAPFSEFLQTFKDSLKNVFQMREDIEQLSSTRGLPPYVLREIMATNPLSAFIPAEHGGRGGKLREGIGLLEAASYESLSLSLIFGINWALFLQPLAKYGQMTAQKPVFQDFIQKQKMGGLMITEPDFGSDALHMQTAWTNEEGSCRLKGTKHWAGLTGWADYWLLTARHFSPGKGLGRDIDFFICDANASGQRIVVEEKFKNLGLYMIPYGLNQIDVLIPESHRLVPQSTGIKMMLDLLHRSRMQFPGMAMGFLRRILDEATEHCRQRKMGDKNLFGYDQVQARLAKMQSAVTICAAMCVNASERAGIENNLAGEGLEANAIKTCVTDLMQEAAQSLLQLVGAKGYKLDHFAGRAIVDSRPFQIFEGSNDILYAQISESLLKQMKVAKEKNLSQFLTSHDLTARASGQLKKQLDFELNPAMPQRKLVELGLLVSRILVLGLVMQLGERGYDKDLIAACLANLKQEIARVLTGYRFDNQSVRSDPDQTAPAWQDFCLPEV